MRHRQREEEEEEEEDFKLFSLPRYQFSDENSFVKDCNILTRCDYPLQLFFDENVDYFRNGEHR